MRQATRPRADAAADFLAALALVLLPPVMFIVLSLRASLTPTPTEIALFLVMVGVVFHERRPRP